MIEPNSSKLVANADNLTAAPWGDLVVCEDRDGDEVGLVGVTPEGKLYTLAHNHAHTEFAGVCFSPDGSTLFVNIAAPRPDACHYGPIAKRGNVSRESRDKNGMITKRNIPRDSRPSTLDDLNG